MKIENKENYRRIPSMKALERFYNYLYAKVKSELETTGKALPNVLWASISEVENDLMPVLNLGTEDIERIVTTEDGVRLFDDACKQAMDKSGSIFQQHMESLGVPLNVGCVLANVRVQVKKISKGENPEEALAKEIERMQSSESIQEDPGLHAYLFRIRVVDGREIYAACPVVKNGEKMTLKYVKPIDPHGLALDYASDMYVEVLKGSV